MYGDNADDEDVLAPYLKRSRPSSMGELWMPKAANAAPAASPIAPMPEEPNDAESDADVDDGSLDEYLARTAAQSELNPQQHDKETVAQANTDPAPAWSPNSDVTKGALIASGIGSFLQRKPFDTQFWGGQIAAQQNARTKAAADAAARRDKELQRQLTLARINSLEGRNANQDEINEMRRTGLDLQKVRLKMQQEAEARKGTALGIQQDANERKKEDRDPNAPVAMAKRVFFARRGVPMSDTEGLSSDDMNHLNPELGKLFAQAAPQANAEIAIAATKAGAEAEARQPYMQGNAEFNANLRERAKAGELAPDSGEVGQFEKQHPKLVVTGSEIYKRESQNRFAVKQRNQDIQNVDRALAASDRLSQLANQWSLADAAGNPESARAAEQEYQLYKDEHQGIILKIAGMGSGGTEGEREEIKGMIPERLNPMAVARLQGVGRFLHSQAHEMLRIHGLGVRSEAEAEGYQQPSASDQQGDLPSLSVTAPADHPARGIPKVSSLPGVKPPASAPKVVTDKQGRKWTKDAQGNLWVLEPGKAPRMVQ